MKSNHPTRLLWAAGFLLSASLLHAAPPVIFTGTLIDGSGQLPVENAVLFIQDRRVVAAGRVDAGPHAKQDGAQVIDCRGKTIMPALISDHSHLDVVKDGKISRDNYTLENIKAVLRQGASEAHSAVRRYRKLILLS